MRTLALTAALATTLAGTGCIVSTNDPLPGPSGDLDLAWRFQNYDGQVAGSFTAGDTGCSVAAVTDVDVSVFDANQVRVAFVNFPCREAGTGLPRAFVSGLRAGSYSFLATAFRTDAPVFEDGGSFFVDANATTQIDATLGVLSIAPLSVYFTQNGLFTCAGTPGIRYDRFTSAGIFIETNTVACDPVSFGFTVPADLPVGFTYQFDLFALNASGSSLFERCLQNVRHTGFPVTLDLLVSPQAACGP